MPTVYLLLGAQGSGKSTWAAANATRLGASVLASDEVRNELERSGAGDPNDGDRVFAIVEAELDRRLSLGQNVIVDATHARRKWRVNEIAIARRRGARLIGVWFEASLEACLRRNAARPGGGWGDRVVPDDYLRWVWQSFEPPQPGEFDEVWGLGERAANSSSQNGVSLA
jgi:predicted kinase